MRTPARAPSLKNGVQKMPKTFGGVNQVFLVYPKNRGIPPNQSILSSRIFDDAGVAPPKKRFFFLDFELFFVRNMHIWRFQPDFTKKN